jgi:hypothetical protein
MPSGYESRLFANYAEAEGAARLAVAIWQAL